jgi:hypothetical protein
LIPSRKTNSVDIPCGGVSHIKIISSSSYFHLLVESRKGVAAPLALISFRFPPTPWPGCGCPCHPQSVDSISDSGAKTNNSLLSAKVEKEKGDLIKEIVVGRLGQIQPLCI